MVFSSWKFIKIIVNCIGGKNWKITSNFAALEGNEISFAYELFCTFAYMMIKKTFAVLRISEKLECYEKLCRRNRFFVTFQ